MGRLSDQLPVMRDSGLKIKDWPQRSRVHRGVFWSHAEARRRTSASLASASLSTSSTGSTGSTGSTSREKLGGVFLDIDLITGKIIDSAFSIHKGLGPGLLESV